MFGEFTKRDIIIGLIVVIVATSLTIEGTYYVLRIFTMYRQDPLYIRGGLKPGQQIK
jgi:hypothetical protein